MFHPAVIAAREAAIHDQYDRAIPGGVVRRDREECWAWRDQLLDAVDADGERLRPLTPAEDAFIACERLLATIDYRYTAERWHVIAKETQDAEPITPFWASQELFLQRIAAIEYARAEGQHPDGILVNVLKARQLGLSTMTQSLITHRLTTQSSVRALTAADVKEQSRYLMSMAELIVKSMPWWLRPTLVPPTQIGDALTFDTGSTLRVSWGKSSRGGYQDDEKAKGNLGRGKTFGLFHLSELSTWERPEQLDDGLFPGVPRRPRTFGVAESTAKGRYDWWHHHWLRSAQGLGRFTNVFIPWYIEPDKYWLPPPDGWEPSDTSKAHAATVERTSPEYLLGKTHRLTKAQLYWYEHMRATFEDDDRLNEFYEEYPATAEEAFQYAGRSVFKPSVLERLRGQERAPIGLVEVMPAADVAQLKAWEREQPSK